MWTAWRRVSPLVGKGFMTHWELTQLDSCYPTAKRTKGGCGNKGEPQQKRFPGLSKQLNGSQGFNSALAPLIMLQITLAFGQQKPQTRIWEWVNKSHLLYARNWVCPRHLTAGISSLTTHACSNVLHLNRLWALYPPSARDQVQDLLFYSENHTESFQNSIFGTFG